MEERVQKILSRCGVASRRQAEGFIAQGRVKINGITAQIGDTADLNSDIIEFDEKRISAAPEKIYLMLHKPVGYVTTMHDERGRKTVAELVQDCGQRVYPVGRLDQYSEGLLLMTNDGALANQLMHPSGAIQKVYHVWTSGFNPEKLVELTSSIEIDGRMTIPAKVQLLNDVNGVSLLEFRLLEGRNRQIRRLCQAANITVIRLRRVQEGFLKLGCLPVGKWRLLSQKEVQQLQAHKPGNNASKKQTHNQESR